MNANTIIGLVILCVLVLAALWVMVRSIRNSSDPGRLLAKYAITIVILAGAIWALANEVGFSFGGAFIVPFVAVALGVLMSVLWTPSIGAMLARPITSLFDGGNVAPEAQAVYSIAIAKKNAGKYQEAVQEIRKQLDRFPHDVMGQMLLAELHADHLDDLPAAEIILRRFCQQPGHAPKNIAYALNVLADYQLKYAQDIDAARESIQQIITLLPGSEEAHAAEQRIAHLGTTEDLLRSREAPTIRLKPGVQNIGLMKDSSALRPEEEAPEKTAARYVDHLREFPQDAEIREKLAVLYATHYRRIDLATGELNQLIAQPNQPPKQVVRLLHLLADLQIKHDGKVDAAKETLERIVALFPGQAAAGAAEQRIAHLKLELRGSEKALAVKLGTYEQNIGLKKR